MNEELRKRREQERESREAGIQVKWKRIALVRRKSTQKPSQWKISEITLPTNLQLHKFLKKQVPSKTRRQKRNDRHRLSYP